MISADHVTLKTAVIMMLEIQLHVTGVNEIWLYIHIDITVIFQFLQYFDQINAVWNDFFQKLKNLPDPKRLNGSV